MKPYHAKTHNCKDIHTVSVELANAKIKADASRAVLQLIADHIEHGVEINPDLITALLFQTDIALAEVSAAITSALCGGER